MFIVQTSAKINLGLEILSKREDGYHNICSVLQSVNLFDEITFDFAPTTTLITNIDSLNVESNLVLESVKTFQEYTKIPVSMSITLRKHIPIGMGLGGGSGNAAGTLFALNEIYSAGLSLIELMSLGKTLGADVPYFFHGGTAVVSGIGDVVTPLVNMLPGNFVLICPKLSIKEKTKSFFQEISQEDFTDGSIMKAYSEDIRQSYEIFNGVPNNAFSRVLLKRFPELMELRTNIQEKLGITVNFTGAGLGMFAITDECKPLKELINSQYYDTYILNTIDHSIKMRSKI